MFLAQRQSAPPLLFAMLALLASSANAGYVLQIPVGPVTSPAAAGPSGPVTLAVSGATCTLHNSEVSCDDGSTGIGIRMAATDGRSLSGVTNLEFYVGNAVRTSATDVGSGYSLANPNQDGYYAYWDPNWTASGQYYGNCSGGCSAGDGALIPQGGTRVNADGSLETFNLQPYWSAGNPIFDSFAMAFYAFPSGMPATDVTVEIKAYGTLPGYAGGPNGEVGAGTFTVRYVP